MRSAAVLFRFVESVAREQGENFILIHAVFFQIGRGAAALIQNTQKDMLGGDVINAHFRSENFGAFQHIFGADGIIHILREQDRRHGRRLFQTAEVIFGVNTQSPQCPGGHAIFFQNNTAEEVFGSHLGAV